jgi:ABC transport system ATP-binding/permease protein
MAAYSIAGKTTFLKVLTGELPFESGTRDVGETIVMGVYDQLGLKLTEEEQKQLTVLDFVMEKVQAHQEANAGVMPQDEARRLLEQFEFPRRRWIERVAMLSGGEKRRLQLLEVICKRPNFLVMDEPSCDMDLNTLAALEAYLNNFKGVVITVSHDRSFADKCSDHLFVFEGDGVVKDFQGSLSEYASCLVDLEDDKIQQQLSGSPGEAMKEERKVAYKEDKTKRNEQRNALRRAKKDMSNIEGAIEKLKAQAATLQQEIDASSNAGWTALADLTKKLDSLKDDIDNKELSWLELAEFVTSEEAEVEALS